MIYKKCALIVPKTSKQARILIGLAESTYLNGPVKCGGVAGSQPKMPQAVNSVYMKPNRTRMTRTIPLKTSSRKRGVSAVNRLAT